MKHATQFLIVVLMAALYVCAAAAPDVAYSQSPPTPSPRQTCVPDNGRSLLAPCLNVLIVNYQSGWNIISGTEGTITLGTDLPLYTLGPSDTGYVALEAGESTPLHPGSGYWAYFDHPQAEAVNILPLPLRPFTIMIPGNKFILIGNPFDRPATVTGADLTLTYDPAVGYQQSASLQVGQGAWAYSADGGTLTLTPIGP